MFIDRIEMRPECKACVRQPKNMLKCEVVTSLTEKQANDPRLPCNLPPLKWCKVKQSPDSPPDKQRRDWGIWPPKVKNGAHVQKIIR